MVGVWQDESPVSRHLRSDSLDALMGVRQNSFPLGVSPKEESVRLTPDTANIKFRSSQSGTSTDLRLLNFIRSQELHVSEHGFNLLTPKVIHAL